MRRLWLVLALAGCPATPPPACITVDTSCSPGYVPTFDNVYSTTLLPTCAQTASCHSSTGRAGGMSFADETGAYQALLSKSTVDPSRFRVVAGDPACSLLIVRTDSPGADYQMPPGTPLDEPTRCALIQWVQNGAMAGSGM
jgi:hypothetical protein